MPRELWAKIAVEIIRDSKLLAREPWERWLWLGLICLTKEMAEEDGILRGYDARALAAVLDLRVAPTKVRGALEAFAAAGMVVTRQDNTIELVHFKKRQALPKDSPEAVRKRQQEWRDRHKASDSNGSVTGSGAVVSNGGVTGSDTRNITGPQSVTRNAEEEVEEEEEKEEDLDLAAEEDRSFVDGSDLRPKSPPPPPVAPLPEKPDPLATYLADTWRIPKADELARAWRLKWRAVDLLAEAKKARAYEQETGKTHPNSPAGFLRGWMRRAAENPTGNSGNGASPPAKTARQRAAETTREADARDRQFREEQARGTDPRALMHRLWLWQHWPTDYPQYAPPEASTA